VHVFFPAIEAHLNTIAASILNEPGMKWLMYIANQVGNKSKSSTLSLRGASGDFSTWVYQAIASMMQLRSLQPRSWL
jgi:hypothetical protein